MLKMRLQRIGRKNDPSYRVVVVDSRQGPKSGKFVDLVGTINPKLDQVQLEKERIQKWLREGVQASPTVHNMLINQKVIDGKKINVLPRKSPIKAEGADEAAAPEAAPEAPADAATETPADASVAQEEKPAEVAA